MREIVYRLETADYKNWIQWNVKRNYSEKARKKTIVIFVVMVAVLMVVGLVVGKNISSMIPTLLLGIVGGVYIIRSTSTEAQEKMLWKRTGLSKLEKSGNYPEVRLELLESGLIMHAENQGMVKMYGYKEIVSIEEIERMFLLETTEKTWQFVAKSAFADEEEQNAFRSLIEAKIEAAKEDPECYSQEAMEREKKAAAGETEQPAEAVDSADAAPEQEAQMDEDAVEIQHVDTSNMGKIGKMAHIMASMAPEQEEEPAAEKSSVEKTDVEKLNAEKQAEEKIEE